MRYSALTLSVILLLPCGASLAGEAEYESQNHKPFRSQLSREEVRNEYVQSMRQRQIPANGEIDEVPAQQQFRSTLLRSDVAKEAAKAARVHATQELM